MIGSLRGRLIDRGADEVLVEVGGVGYRVTVTPATVVAIGDLGDEVFLFVHHHVREDAQTLYGFPTRDERDTFEVLIGANGVGPKLALAILSVHSPGVLRRALVDDDLDALTMVPGVGKRTAQRLMIELKARLEAPALEQADAASVPPSGRAEVRAALSGLGYQSDEVRDVLAQLPDEGPVEDLLRNALKLLAVTRV